MKTIASKSASKGTSKGASKGMTRKTLHRNETHAQTLHQTLARRTTGIGSLPHHNIDTALEYSFQFGLPFLPQIPIRSPWELMITQALEGLPGLVPPGLAPSAEPSPHSPLDLDL